MRAVAAALLVLMLGLASPVSALASQHWFKAYKASGDEKIWAVKTLEDGRIIAVGSILRNQTPRHEDALVMMLSPEGKVLWAKTFDNGGDDRFEDAVIAKNGDIVAVGFTSGPDKNSDVLVIRMTQDGEVLWEKTYGGKKSDWASGVTVSEIGDIIVAASTKSFGAGDTDIWVLRLKGDGEVLWSRTYGTKDFEKTMAVALAPNGDITVAGVRGFLDGLVLRLDGNGNLIWAKSYGGSGTDWLFDVVVTENGSIITAGSTDSFGKNMEDAWIMELDSRGEVLWTKTYGQSNDDSAEGIALLGDRILVAGTSYLFNEGRDDVLLFSVDMDGNLIWKVCYGGSGFEEAFAIDTGGDGSIVVGGHLEDSGSIGDDVLLIRLPGVGALGNCELEKKIDMHELDVPFKVVGLNFTSTEPKVNGVVVHLDEKSWNGEERILCEFKAVLTQNSQKIISESHSPASSKAQASEKSGGICGPAFFIVLALALRRLF